MASYFAIRCSLIVTCHSLIGFWYESVSMIYYGLCAVKPQLMTICICSHSPVLASLPQLHLRASGIRFPKGARNLDPWHAPFTGGFTLLRESNATADLTVGGTQAVLWAMGRGCKYKPSFACPLTAHILLCSLVLGTPALRWRCEIER